MIETSWGRFRGRRRGKRRLDQWDLVCNYSPSSSSSFFIVIFIFSVFSESFSVDYYHKFRCCLSFDFRIFCPKWECEFDITSLSNWGFQAIRAILRRLGLTC